jgi:integrase
MRQRQPGVWEVRLEAGRDPLTGRRLQISRSVRGNKRDAQKVLNELAVQADRGRHSGTSLTFLQLCEEWLELVEDDLSPTTLRTYRNLLSKRIYPAIGDLPAKKVKPSDLDRLYKGLIQRVGLAPKSVRQIHAIIRRAFRQGELWGWVNDNPATKATPPRLRKSDVSPPDVEQVKGLISLARERDPEFSHFLHIAATTGARRGEICALRWSNLDPVLGTLSIERNIVEVSGGLVEKDTKTHQNRRIAIDSETVAVFENQRAFATKRAKLIAAVIGESGFIFSNEPDGSQPWAPGSVTKKFNAIRKELGAESVRLHDLRHFSATHLVAAGVPIRTVSGRLGHANAATTLAVYSHFVEASDQDAARVIGGLVSSLELKSSSERTSKGTVTKGTHSGRKRQ